MKVVQINAVCGYGSTGRICVDISKLLNEENIENYIIYTGRDYNYDNGINLCDTKYLKIQSLKSRIFGNYGFNSKKITKKLICQLENIKPDIVHLHNIHGHNVNLEILFNYLKNTDMKVVWTFHDCWTFTGYCMYFDYTKCGKWENECRQCIQYKKFSWFFDRSNWIFKKKKELFTGLKNLTIVSPSQWLADLTKESFLQKYPVKVINNGIDLDIFKPTESDFRKKYSLLNKTIILGIAMGFGERKGFKYFIELSKLIDENARIVLVGVSKEQISELPSNIIGIERTANQIELAQIYTAADVFLNCTLEDNFPTVNLEALACGTPVITFKTGGSVECIDENIGAIVEQGDIKSALEKINEVLKIENVSSNCREKAVSMYYANKKFQEYVELYYDIMREE